MISFHPPSPEAPPLGGEEGEARVLLRSRADKATAKQNTASERFRPMGDQEGATGLPVGLHTRALRGRRAGFILSEFLVSVAVLMAATLSLIMEGTAHLTLAEHARNVGVATNDALRTLEQLRQQNTGTSCVAPSPAWPGGFDSWDAWLGAAGGGGGKSIQPNPLTNEMVLVRTTGANPLQVTVSVCWRHRNRTLGGCGWNGVQLTDPGGVAPVPSPVQLFSRVTCQP